MSFWTRIINVFRGERVEREIAEELQSHVREAIEAGRDAREVRAAFGGMLKLREESRDARLLPWLDSVRADAIFGWRQIRKRKATSAAAVLSLALAIGSSTAAFRLIDALLLRPLPVAGADRLFSVTFASPSGTEGAITHYDSCSYPMFRRMREAVRGEGDSVAISMYTGAADLTYGSDQEMEQANLQYVSGWMFATFGLRPAAGRLLTTEDDEVPGAHPYAVLSYDYWSRRFGRNPSALGRTFRLGNDVYQIVGVAEQRFTGTETGWATDVFVPMTMKNPRTLASLNSFWLRTLVQLKPGASPGRVEETLRAVFHTIQEERLKGFPAQSQRDRDRLFQEQLSLEPAAAGRSNLQRQYREALAVMGMLVALVLVIACANVANLMTAQAASRAREMALRVSIGAGRWRLAQLAMLESAWLAALATALGGIFAWWAAPFIVERINPRMYATRLVLRADWRVLGFALALACAVMFLFGLTPALRASAVKPVSALRGGEDPHARGRLMRLLIAVQVAFCFMVNLAGGLFVATFERLSNQPTGFSAERIANVEAVTSSPQAPVLWEQVAERLRELPGVEKVALIGWPLMSGESAVGSISINGAPPGDIVSDFVTISPGWADVMRIPLLRGREFRADDVNPTVAIVNQSFAKQYFGGEDPVGRWFDRVEAAGARSHFQVVGLIRDARSRDRMRVPIRPTAYIPFRSVGSKGAFVPMSRGTFVVRTEAANPLALASALRREVGLARPGFRVRDVLSQVELNEADTLRERLLALLGTFFAGVAWLLAGVGLYGVLQYSVVERRREIGIRMAIGARPGDIARRVSREALTMVFAGGAAGLGLGVALVRYVESLFYHVKATDFAILAVPALAILSAALAATLPAVMRAVRIDPAAMLREE
ncbi:MAG TPA: ADOP family duplicated permease [Bryobacteraceae bacterium]|nr:ADOP family duplicated permease [Bryobacteraceae bacterium]